MLQVIIPATNTDLTTLGHVQDELKLEVGQDEALLGRLIKRATATIQTYCDRVFARQTYRESVAGFGGTSLALSMRPLITVSAVTHNGNPLVDYTVEDSAAGMLFRERGWEWTTGIAWGLSAYPIPRSEDPTFLVDYVAGWILPSDVTEGYDLPADVEGAAIEAVRVWYTNRTRNPAIAAKRIGDISINYLAGPSQAEATDFHGLPPIAVGLLQGYRS